MWCYTAFLVHCIVVPYLVFHVACSTNCGRKEEKDYAFWRQFDEKQSIMPRCPVQTVECTLEAAKD